MNSYGGGFVPIIIYAQSFGTVEPPGEFFMALESGELMITENSDLMLTE